MRGWYGIRQTLCSLIEKPFSLNGSTQLKIKKKKKQRSTCFERERQGRSKAFPFLQAAAKVEIYRIGSMELTS